MSYSEGDTRFNKPNNLVLKIGVTRENLRQKCEFSRFGLLWCLCFLITNIWVTELNSISKLDNFCVICNSTYLHIITSIYVLMCIVFLDIIFVSNVHMHAMSTSCACSLKTLYLLYDSGSRQALGHLSHGLWGVLRLLSAPSIQPLLPPWPLQSTFRKGAAYS